jgi:nitroimidazol reductase NimA-like FMN-containing flavoprotein (pyridoxamine 5'-phosphate oxidase superfamily)
VNYAWSDGKIWLHCATEGRKLDIIRANPKVSFQVTADTELEIAENPCSYGIYYSSVEIFGTASIIEGHEAKAGALLEIMRHFSKDFSYEFTEAMTKNICVISIEPNEITCKAKVKQ